MTVRTSRRQVIQGFGGAGFVSVAGLPHFAFAQAQTGSRLLVLLLRGAMDGLSAVAPYGDPDHERTRNGIALPKPGAERGGLKLDGMFALNPWPPALHGLYGKGEMLAVHAIASPYRERSHFDAQNLVENGSAKPYGLSTGWLNRALAGIAPKGRDAAIAITPSMPVILRGQTQVSTWSPSDLPAPDADLVGRVQALCKGDPVLSAEFEKARTANAGVGGSAGQGTGFAAQMAGAARFLKDPNGPRVAFAEQAGWDTHAGQMAEEGPLHQAMRALNTGVEAFRKDIGDVWAKTVIVIVTEFGRTVAMNGSNGTDHGTAGAAFLLCRRVRGGRVIADWPGLKQAQLQDSRDLKPTTDMRALFKGVLRYHLGVEESRLARDVFPDTAALRPMEGLIEI